MGRNALNIYFIHYYIVSIVSFPLVYNRFKFIMVSSIAVIAKDVVNCHALLFNIVHLLSISSGRKIADTIQKRKAMDLMNTFYQNFFLQDSMKELDQLYCKLIKK